MATPLSAAFSTAASTHQVSDALWNNELLPGLEALKHRAGPIARKVLWLYSSDRYQVSDAARAGMRDFLRGCGYQMPEAKPTGIKPVDIYATLKGTNVGEEDKPFARLCKLAGRADADCLVAVLDTGVDPTHDELEARLAQVPGPKIEGLNDGDCMGHGTYVAGLISKGTTHIKVLGFQVTTANGIKDDTVVPNAIDEAAKLGARIINLSLGDFTEPHTVQTIVDAIKRHPSVLFTFAAGNDGKELNATNFPASSLILRLPELSNVAVVGACDRSGAPWEHSNFGKDIVEFAALGVGVYSDVPNDGYYVADGSSDSDPLVANAAARCLILDPALTPENLKTLLEDTSVPMASWATLIESPGPCDPEAAAVVAALSGLLRAGTSSEAALTQLELDPAHAAKALALAQRLVQPSAFLRAEAARSKTAAA